MKRPILGLTARLIADNGDACYQLDRKYVDALVAAGGDPVVLPFVRTAAEAGAWLDRLDGLVLTGGADIDPARWGEPRHEKAKLLHPDKERSDFHFAGEALRRDRPVLAICLGCQVVNVALGGSLHQHIEGHAGGQEHPVEVGVSKLLEIVGRTPTVNSYHHQAVNRVGRDLRVTARAADGTVEALEGEKNRFVLAVQWHPERIADRPEQGKLFAIFVREAARG
jgi:putative glutamine amidotransferase